MLLNVSRVSKNYGVDVILEDVSLRLDRREKTALVGRNGCGKTTLLRMILGMEEPDSGSIQLARGAKVSCLQQETPIDLAKTVLEEAQGGLSHAVEIQARLKELELSIEQGGSQEDLDEYSLLLEHFSEAEGYSVEHDVRVVLLRMGFSEDEFDKPCSALSGGERTRLALARILLEEPELLILDEPTNHLDLQAAEWLEGWIRQYHGAVLLVSHDRTFLERTAESVVEIRDHTAKTYPGNFQQYLRLRAEEDAAQADLAGRQAQEIAKLDEYVRRFMNSQRTAQARGRLKQMEKLKQSRVHAPKAEAGMKAGFREMKRSGDLVLEAEGLSLGFDGTPLFSGLDWRVAWGERWGVVGENGAGKSTLIKAALGRMEPMAGRVRLGAGVDFGYFSQDVSELDPEWSPLEYIIYACDLEAAKARDLLGRFLFSGDDVFRSISTLSGGEKNKLVLARLTYENPNLLILDEPTNHLDMASREALAQVLQQYTGTLLLISHDRWLLNQVTDRTLAVRKAGPELYPGPYDEYRRSNEKGAGTQPKKSAAPVVVAAPAAPARSAREVSKEIQRLEKLLAEIEDQVAESEADLADVERSLSHLPANADVLTLTREHAEIQEELAGRLSAWENIGAELEGLRALQSG